jgi:hypothetical protein
MTLFLLAAVLAAEPPASPFIGGGAVVSPDAKVVFAPAKVGGVEALDVATGKIVWGNKDAKQIAGASGKVVVAWVAEEKKPNAFRAVLIDATEGKTLAKSDPIALPDWATTEKVGGRSFRIAARAEGDGDKVTVAWQANAFYFGGAAPTEEILAAARKEAVGVVSIDPASGKIAKLDRKPKAEEFGAFTNKAGDYEFRVTEMIPGFKPGAPMVTQVKLAVLKGKTELWTRELAGNPWSPPPP